MLCQKYKKNGKDPNIPRIKEQPNQANVTKPLPIQKIEEPPLKYEKGSIFCNYEFACILSCLAQKAIHAQRPEPIRPTYFQQNGGK